MECYPVYDKTKECIRLGKYFGNYVAQDFGDIELEDTLL